jgi:hypothetical protein
MKTSDSEKSGGKCPACGGRTKQDLKNRGFVGHRERFVPTDPAVPRNEKGLCRFGRGGVDLQNSVGPSPTANTVAQSPLDRNTFCPQ